MRPETCEASLLSDIRLDLRRLKNGYGKILDEFDKAMALPARERSDRLDSFCKSFFVENSEFFGLGDLANTVDCDADYGKIAELRQHAIHDCADEGLIDADEFGLNGQNPDYAEALEAVVNGYEPEERFESEQEKLREHGHREGDF